MTTEASNYVKAFQITSGAKHPLWQARLNFEKNTK